MRIEYLEIVTPEVEATCALYERLHGVTFGAAVAALGNARTAALASGGRIGVRAPLHPSEAPVVRPYLLVDDVDAATAAAAAAGAEVAHPPFDLPGQGRFAILVKGAVQHGLWQRPDERRAR